MHIIQSYIVLDIITANFTIILELKSKKKKFRRYTIGVSYSPFEITSHRVLSSNLQEPGNSVGLEIYQKDFLLFLFSSSWKKPYHGYRIITYFIIQTDDKLLKMPLRILTNRLKILRVTLLTVSYKAAAVDLCNLFPFSASNFTHY